MVLHHWECRKSRTAHGEGASGGVFLCGDDDGGGSNARCASSSRMGAGLDARTDEDSEGGLGGHFGDRAGRNPTSASTWSQSARGKRPN